MLLDLLTSKGDMTSVLIGLMASVFVVFCTLPIHEFAHAFVATKLGDDTARLKGRLTMNPLAHVDPFGALMVLLVGFGYAQPVPVNVRNVRMKNKKLAMAIIALAGPVSNLIIAFISMFIMYLIAKLVGTSELIAYAFIIFRIEIRFKITIFCNYYFIILILII